MNPNAPPPTTPAAEQIWQEQDLKLAQEISIWGYRLLDDWPLLDHEIATWTARMIHLLRLTPPEPNASADPADPADPVNTDATHSERHL